MRLGRDVLPSDRELHARLHRGDRCEKRQPSKRAPVHLHSPRRRRRRLLAEGEKRKRFESIDMGTKRGDDVTVSQQFLFYMDDCVLLYAASYNPLPPLSAAAAAA